MFVLLRITMRIGERPAMLVKKKRGDRKKERKGSLG